MPLAWLALGVVLGLFAGSVWAAPAPAILLPLGGLGGAWALARSGGLRVGLPLLVAAGVLLGVLRAGPGLLAPEGLLPRFHGQEVELRGTLTGVAELVGAQVRFRLEAEAVRGDGTWRPSTGAVQVWAGANIDPVDGRGHPFLAHGDVVTLRGVLDAPRSIGSFDYREHLAARGIGSELARASVVGVEPAGGGGLPGAVHAVRGELSDAIERHVAEPQAALTRALLLGMRGRSRQAWHATSATRAWRTSSRSPGCTWASCWAYRCSRRRLSSAVAEGSTSSRPSSCCGST